MKRYISFCIGVFCWLGSFAQDFTPIYFESTGNDLTLFYYNTNYYLTDKHCQYRSIVREALYDFDERQFRGSFRDVDNQGRLVLSGNYRDGVKEGIFTAYHYNGQVKWEGSYEADKRAGTWKYYYPDGKPYLEITYKQPAIHIDSYWDLSGRQRVKNGNGRYEATIQTSSYNEIGYVAYTLRGRLRGGQPQGLWRINHVFDDGKTAFGASAYYNNGEVTLLYLENDELGDSDEDTYLLFPQENYAHSETLLSQHCTIDEQSGFVEYLKVHLNNWYQEYESEVQRIEFAIAVSERGIPTKVEAIKTFENNGDARVLLGAINWIPYWFPSFADGEFIADTITLRASVFPDLIEKKLKFYDIQLIREKGF